MTNFPNLALVAICNENKIKRRSWHFYALYPFDEISTEVHDHIDYSTQYYIGSIWLIHVAYRWRPPSFRWAVKALFVFTGTFYCNCIWSVFASNLSEVALVALPHRRLSGIIEDRDAHLTAGYLRLAPCGNFLVIVFIPIWWTELVVRWMSRVRLYNPEDIPLICSR